MVTNFIKNKVEIISDADIYTDDNNNDDNDGDDCGEDRVIVVR